MSDDMPRAPSDPEPLPTELLRIERQLLADGAAWERHVPPTSSFIQRMRLALQEDTMRDAETSIEQSGDETRPRRLSLGEERGPRSSSRWRALVATVAAVLVVGLLGAVFAALAHNHSQPSVAGKGPHQLPPTGAPTLAPIGTQVHTQIGPLTKQPSATNQPGTPIVAPSNPKVMYEYADNGSGPVLRRSDDGSKSWHDLTFPMSTESLGALYLAVSPLDAQNVFLEMDTNIAPGGRCPTPDGRGASSICPQTYWSNDGGTIWHPVFFPVAGSIFGNGVVFYYNSTAVQGQGNRLYARVYDSLTPTNPALDIRILSSTDLGATWQVADAALAKQAPHVCTYAATPAGSTLFAVSMAGCTSGGAETLWRSDDAGATWAKVGTVPDFELPNGPALVAANVQGDPSRPLLYSAQPAGALTVSADGGKTWQPAPSAGLPSGARMVMLANAALPDGSLVAAFSGGAAAGGQTAPTQATPTPTSSVYGPAGVVGCFYWSPGASAWQSLTPGVTILPSDLDNVFVSNTSAGLVVTLSIGDISTSDPRYTIQPFA